MAKAAPKTAKKTSKKTVATTAKKLTKKTTKKAAAPKAAAKKADSKGGSSASLPLGQKAPAFSRPATSGKTISLAELKGKKVVLYFYPKDNTPGCTMEGQDFKRLSAAFAKTDCVIIGVSKDSLKSHENFKSKCGFPFELISDEDESLCRAYNVIQMKKLYGREFLGIERSTFLIDSEGRLQREWRKVKVTGHAEEVLAAAEQLG